MRSVILALLVATTLVAAQQTINTVPNLVSWVQYSDPRCTGPTWSKVDRTSDYVAGYNGTIQICVKTYISVCSGPTGVIACNQYYGSCKAVGYNWNNKVLNPNSYTVNAPQICAMDGSFMAPDTKVIAVAEIMFGFFTYILAFALAIPVGRAVKGWGFIVLVLQLITSFTLMFSYYYLNGIITLAASIAALALFKPRKPVLTGVGILMLLSAFYWVTFRFGLGNVQHQSRFDAGLATMPTYETMCINYYRGYFTFNADLNAVDADPAQAAWGYCGRGWLTAVLFFMIFAEILLVLLAATGIQALLFEEPKLETSETEPVQN